MPKLHLKRTPAEEAERAHRRARKDARKEAKRRRLYELEEDFSDVDGRPSKRRNRGWYEYPEEDLDEQPGANGLDDDALRRREEQRLRREEDERFQQRMWDELGDQERLDNLETNLNSYSHIPHRWRPSGDGEPGVKPNPQIMEDEEYAEWIREGMWRKHHGDLYQEQLRKKAAEEVRKTREREFAAESARLEAAAVQERRKKKRERERSRWKDANERYETQWKALLAGEGDEDSLSFGDIPWPCIEAYGKTSSPFSIEHLTEESISGFLFKSTEGADMSRKDKLRETLLRFHPDKFEGRVMNKVKFVDKERVQEAVGIVVRTLNELSKSK